MLKLKRQCFGHLMRKTVIGKDPDAGKDRDAGEESESENEVAQSCPILCHPVDCSTPGLPVHHQLPEFTQTHVHRVGNAIQPSHPLFSPSPSAFSLSQYQGLF